jgi:hydrogenase maturation protease
VVIGLGNDIAGDDGVGILAVRRLRERLRDRSGITMVELPWAGLELLPVLRGRRRAVLIDSLQSGLHAPGTVVELSETELAGSVRLNSFHDLNYPTAIALGRALGWSLPDDIRIYAVEGECFDEFKAQLTPAVARGLEQVVDQIASFLTAAGGAESSDAEDQEPGSPAA